MSATTLGTLSERRKLLHTVLLVDGVLCAAIGAVLAVAAGPLGDLFDVPTLLLRLVGIGLLPWAGVVLFIATRPVVTPRGAWLVIGGNLVWMVASVVLLFSGWVDPSALGVAFIFTQAAIVAVIADVQFLALRRQRSAKRP